MASSRKTRKQNLGRVAIQKVADNNGSGNGKTKAKSQLVVVKPRQRMPQKASATSFGPGNPFRFKPGVSGNPGGRPKAISDAYKTWLAADSADGSTTNAAIIAQNIGLMASVGDVSAAKEIRQATEGDKVAVDLSQLSDAELDQRIAELEGELRAHSARAGAARDSAPGDGGANRAAVAEPVLQPRDEPHL